VQFIADVNPIICRTPEKTPFFNVIIVSLFIDSLNTVGDMRPGARSLKMTEIDHFVIDVT
jgi:hypothetical protein